MKTAPSSLLKIFLLSIGVLSFAACGQKGPLEVEQPIPVQEEEPEQTL